MTVQRRTTAPAPDRLGGHGGGRDGRTADCRRPASVPPEIIRRYGSDDTAAGAVLADLVLVAPTRSESSDDA